MPRSSPRPADSNHKLWLAYAGLCLLSWMLYAMAGTELQRGIWQLWGAVYQATLSLWPPMLLGVGVLPWVGWLQRRSWGAPASLGLHALAALLFAALWQGLEFLTAWWLFGADHAEATLQQLVLWRAIWGVFVYIALVAGFAAVLNARRARASAVAAA
ncbi:hypothetical protein, partial [Paucibacter sp. XJ19-41]|uniref:hypothetical protein n=1 Tax=Paucibacter sp. XJ19-41 TaxID=2927824 RepID=UPI00234ACAC6